MERLVRAVRGATTVDEDTPRQITERVTDLVNELLARNSIHHDDLVSIIFTATEDISRDVPGDGRPHDRARRCAADLRQGDLGGRGHAEVHPRPRPRLLGAWLAPSSIMSTWKGPGGCVTTCPSRRASIVGLGLIGGSIGLGLRACGWHVSGADLDESTAARAVGIGAVDVIGADPDAEVAFVCTPADAVAAAALDLLAGSPGAAVTDVCGVKGSIVGEVPEVRFVGGHPMAGSEQDGIAGAAADLFRGATWVLTPTAATDPDAFTRVRGVVSALGADVVALPPALHDRLVALVSHVPHLTAATLMALAADASVEQEALLRLAAGGFRDMTRIAAGRPGIWPAVCSDNAEAILEAMDALIERLVKMRAIVAAGDRQGLMAVLERARHARQNLPLRGPRPGLTVELRVPVPDRPGVLAEVTTLIGGLGVNIVDLEIAHSSEGASGVLVLAIDAAGADRVRDALSALGYRPSVGSME